MNGSLPELAAEVVEEAQAIPDEVFVPVSGCCEDCDDLLAAGGSR